MHQSIRFRTCLLPGIALLLSATAFAQAAPDPSSAPANPVNGVKIVTNWQEAFALNRDRFIAMEKRMTGLEAQLAEAQNRADRIEAASRDSSHRAAVLLPGEQGYSALDTGIGRITVAITGVKPVGTGTRVTLQFGNPTTANLSSLQASIEWGEGAAVDDMASAVRRSMTFRPATGVPASSWRSFDIDIPGPPARLGWIRVSEMFVHSISLAKPGAAN